ncbi:hypothetical protein K8I31_22635 [bacterium]|nr:hypothetical protein [bacterium]
MRVLFVEDSEKLQRSVSLGLRKAGFKVDATGDGQQGLWRALSFDYDVIVLDLMLHRRRRISAIFIYIGNVM